MIELDVFTTIGEGADTVTAFGKAMPGHSLRRSHPFLCEYLTILGFLTKKDGCYALTLDSAMFLDRRSPALLAPLDAMRWTSEPEGKCQ